MEPGSIGNCILVFSGLRLLRNLLLLFTLCLLASICAAQTSPQAPLIVTHKLPELNSTERVLHEVEVLKLALDKTITEFGPYELHGIPPMNRARTLVALSHNVYPNLILQMSYEDELAEQEKLAFIPFPLDRGALSYRICFMRDSLNATAKSITHLDQLKDYHFGVGIGWADGKILRHNDLQVIESNSVVSLFRMTKAGRIDFFCRGASEFFYEQQDPNSLGLTSDTQLALYYPLPKFFFAHKESKAVLNRVQKGLEIAYKDGSFNKLWSKRHLHTLERAQLKQRNVITLQNPLIKHLARDYEIYLYGPINQ
ncbi:hypothetical protein [Cellvibrio sp.]